MPNKNKADFHFMLDPSNCTKPPTIGVKLSTTLLRPPWSISSLSWSHDILGPSCSGILKFKTVGRHLTTKSPTFSSPNTILCCSQSSVGWSSVLQYTKCLLVESILPIQSTVHHIKLALLEAIKWVTWVYHIRLQAWQRAHINCWVQQWWMLEKASSKFQTDDWKNKIQLPCLSPKEQRGSRQEKKTCFPNIILQLYCATTRESLVI